MQPPLAFEPPQQQFYARRSSYDMGSASPTPFRPFVIRSPAARQGALANDEVGLEIRQQQQQQRPPPQLIPPPEQQAAVPAEERLALASHVTSNEGVAAACGVSAGVKVDGTYSHHPTTQDSRSRPPLLLDPPRHEPQANRRAIRVIRPARKTPSPSVQRITPFAPDVSTAVEPAGTVDFSAWGASKAAVRQEWAGEEVIKPTTSERRCFYCCCCCWWWWWWWTPGGLLDAYAEALETQPLVFKCFTSAVIAGLGDLCSQSIFWARGGNVVWHNVEVSVHGRPPLRSSHIDCGLERCVPGIITGIRF